MWQFIIGVALGTVAMAAFAYREQIKDFIAKLKK